MCEVGRVFPRHIQRTCPTGESPLGCSRVARTLRLYNYLLRFHLTMGPDIYCNCIALINIFLAIKIVSTLIILLFLIPIRLPRKGPYINGLKLAFLTSGGSISRG